MQGVAFKWYIQCALAVLAYSRIQCTPERSSATFLMALRYISYQREHIKCYFQNTALLYFCSYMYTVNCILHRYPIETAIFARLKLALKRLHFSFFALFGALFASLCYLCQPNQYGKYQFLFICLSFPGRGGYRTLSEASHTCGRQALRRKLKQHTVLCKQSFSLEINLATEICWKHCWS